MDPSRRSPLAAPRLFNHAPKWNVSKGAETAGASPFLAPSEANKSNSEPCLSTFWLELDGLRLISSGVIWCFISLGSPTDEKQRDRVVRLAVLTAEGSRMTEPQANNSHYPSASPPFGNKEKKNIFCAIHIWHFHKQETVETAWRNWENDLLPIFVGQTNTAWEIKKTCRQLWSHMFLRTAYGTRLISQCWK